MTKHRPLVPGGQVLKSNERKGSMGKRMDFAQAHSAHYLKDFEQVN